METRLGWHMVPGPQPEMEDPRGIDRCIIPGQSLRHEIQAGDRTQKRPTRPGYTPQIQGTGEHLIHFSFLYYVLEYTCSIGYRALAQHVLQHFEGNFFILCLLLPYTICKIHFSYISYILPLRPSHFAG